MSRDLPAAVAVELDAAELGGPVRVGSLRRVPSASGAVVAFAYDATWLARSDAFVLDPAHGLYPGDQYPRAGDAIAAAFTDAAPDRWGRTLLERREAGRAREEGRLRRTLGEWEFLLGVSDFSRMGALRFVDDAGRYLDDEPPGVPPLAGLRELEAAARALEQPSRGDRSREAERLALLLAPGSSLGGARPKATSAGVRDRPAGCATDWEVVVVAAVLAARSEKAAAHRLGLSHYGATWSSPQPSTSSARPISTGRRSRGSPMGSTISWTTRPSGRARRTASRSSPRRTASGRSGCPTAGSRRRDDRRGHLRAGGRRGRLRRRP